MSIDASLRRVCELVEAVAVVEGEGLLWLDPDAGDVPALADVHEGPDRLFELGSVRVVDAGEGGCVPARVRVLCDLRIRYRARGSRHGRMVTQATDARLIRDALMFTPSDWDYATTRLVSVLCGESLAAEPLSPEGEAVPPVHEVVTIPLTLEVDL